MRKKIMFLIVVFSLLVTSCGSNQEITEDQVDDTQMNEEVGNDVQDNLDAEDDAEIDNTDATDNESNEDESNEDTSLSGYDLLESIEVKENNQLYVEATTQADGFSYVTKMTIYEDSMRVETEDGQGLTLMIYDGSKGITYMYNSIEGQGMMYHDTDMDLDMEFLPEDEEMEFESTFDESYIENIEGLRHAEMTTLDGMEVLYLEVQTDMGEEDYISKEWISTEYWYPIKTEVYIGDQLTSSYRVNEITNDFQMDESTFSPPDDIEFIDMEQLYEMYDMEGLEGDG